MVFMAFVSVVSVDLIVKALRKYIEPVFIPSPFTHAPSDSLRCVHVRFAKPVTSTEIPVTNSTMFRLHRMKHMLAIMRSIKRQTILPLKFLNFLEE
jgi:hypothetical protein